MRPILKTCSLILSHLLIVVILTLLTQVGGLVWLLTLALDVFVQRRRKIRFFKTGAFATLYITAILVIVPPLARQFGRVPLPAFSNPHLKPENILFCLFNRQYVRPELKSALESVALKMQEQFPGTIIRYMDANFPLIEGYPLEPHFSHRDGKKVDIAFFWKGTKTGKQYSGTPSPFGYGVCIEPKPDEYDYNAECEKQGFWYIAYDQRIASCFYNKDQYVSDEPRNKEMTRLFAEEKGVRKILLQPHLKTRWGLEKYDKLRPQGCRAARHDDHIHVQL